MYVTAPGPSKECQHGAALNLKLFGKIVSKWIYHKNIINKLLVEAELTSKNFHKILNF